MTLGDRLIEALGKDVVPDPAGQAEMVGLPGLPIKLQQSDQDRDPHDFLQKSEGSSKTRTVAQRSALERT